MFSLFCENENGYECKNLKTRNNYSLHVQEVLLCKNEPKMTVDKFIVLNVL